jgi:hypothetical protein
MTVRHKILGNITGTPEEVVTTLRLSCIASPPITTNDEYRRRVATQIGKISCGTQEVSDCCDRTFLRECAAAGYLEMIDAA